MLKGEQKMKSLIRITALAVITAVAGIMAGCGGGGGSAPVAPQAGGSAFKLNVDLPRSGESSSEYTYSIAVSVLDYGAAGEFTSVGETTASLTWDESKEKYTGSFVVDELPSGSNFVCRVIAMQDYSATTTERMAAEATPYAYLGGIADTINDQQATELAINATSTVSTLATLYYAISKNAAITDTSVIIEDVEDAIEDTVASLIASSPSYANQFIYPYYTGGDPFVIDNWSTSMRNELLDITLSAGLEADTTAPQATSVSPASGGTVVFDGPVFTIYYNERMDSSVNLNNSATLSESGFALTLERQDATGTITITTSNADDYGTFAWTTTSVAYDTLTYTFKSNDTLAGNSLTVLVEDKSYAISTWTLPDNVKDLSGNTVAATSITTTGTISTTAAPVQSAWSPSSGSTLISTTQTISFTVSPAATCRWSLTDQDYSDMSNTCSGSGGTSQSCNVTGLSDGAASVYISCTDSSGNADTADSNTDLSYTVDATLPTISNISPTAGTTLTSSSSSITFDTDESATCRWSLMDYGYTSMSGTCSGGGTTSHSCPATGLVDGSETVYLACQDTAGGADTYLTNSAVTYTVDTTPPVGSSFSPTSASIVIAASQTVTFVTNETATCKWSLSDQSYADMSNTCSGGGTTSQSCDTGGLTEGSNSLYFACVDALSNEDTALTNDTVSYTLDTTLPAQSAWNPATSTILITTSPAISLSTDEAATCRWSLSDDAYGSMSYTCSGGGTTSHSCSVSGLSEGTDTVYIACADTGGNEESAGDNTELEYSIDISLPAQSNWSPADAASIATMSPTVTFDTDEAADCKWDLTDLAYSSMTGDCSGDGTTSQSCSVSGLVEGSNYVYLACQDTPGNQDTISSNTMLSYTVDTTPPVQSNWSPADSGTLLNTPTPLVTFTTDENADCKWSLTDQSFSAMGTYCIGAGSTSQACAVNGLLQGTQTVYFACSDTLGNSDSDTTNTELTYFVDSTLRVIEYYPADGDTGVAYDGPEFKMIFNESMDTSVDLNDSATLVTSGFALSIQDSGMTTTNITTTNALDYGSFSWTTTNSSNDTLSYTFKDNTTLSGLTLNTISPSTVYTILAWTLPVNLYDDNGNSLDYSAGPDATGSFTTAGP